jgi:hypothetical protein
MPCSKQSSSSRRNWLAPIRGFVRFREQFTGKASPFPCEAAGHSSIAFVVAQIGAFGNIFLNGQTFS